MIESASGFLGRVAISVVAILLVRSLPAFLFALTSPKYGMGAKVGAGSCFAGLALSLGPEVRAQVSHWFLYLFYAFCATSWLIGLAFERASRGIPSSNGGFSTRFRHEAAGARVSAWAGDWSALIWLIFAFAVLAWAPAMLIFPEAPVGRAVCAVMGTELSLSVASLRASGRQGASIQQGLFFVLVDPSASFRHRARPCRNLQPKKPRWPTFTGAGLIFLSVLFSGLLTSVTPPLSAYDPGFGIAGISLLTFYLGHAGVACFQLGVMRLLGYRVSLRYDKPWRAQTPRDFWRRWNIYLGAWLRTHIFWPASRATGSTSAGVLLAFLVCGLLHAAAVSVAAGRPAGSYLVLIFVVHGVLVASWRPTFSTPLTRVLLWAVMAPLGYFTMRQLGG